MLVQGRHSFSFCVCRDSCVSLHTRIYGTPEIFLNCPLKIHYNVNFRVRQVPFNKGAFNNITYLLSLKSRDWKIFAFRTVFPLILRPLKTCFINIINNKIDISIPFFNALPLIEPEFNSGNGLYFDLFLAINF